MIDGTSTGFTLGFEVESAAKMAISAKIEESAGNWFSLNFAADADEEIYGMGLQYTEWNFKNKSVPLIISEGGVGRGLQPITRELNLDGGGGGNTMTSYAPTAQFITNKARAFQFDNTEIGIASFNTDSNEMLYWHSSQIDGHLLTGVDFMELT